MSLTEGLDSFRVFFHPVQISLTDQDQSFCANLQDLASLAEEQAECALFCDCWNASFIQLKHDGMVFVLDAKNSPFSDRPWATFLNKGAERVVGIPAGGNFLKEVDMAKFLLRILAFGQVQQHFSIDESLLKMYLSPDIRKITGFIYPPDTNQPVVVFSNQAKYQLP